MTKLKVKSFKNHQKHWKIRVLMASLPFFVSIVRSSSFFDRPTLLACPKFLFTKFYLLELIVLSNSFQPLPLLPNSLATSRKAKQPGDDSEAFVRQELSEAVDSGFGIRFGSFGVLQGGSVELRGYFCGVVRLLPDWAALLECHSQLATARARRRAPLPSLWLQNRIVIFNTLLAGNTVLVAWCITRFLPL